MSETTEIPGFTAGTWTIDASHSEVGFSVRHLMISKVRGTFGDFDGTFVTTDNPLETTVTAAARVASIDTGDANRDGHLRTNDFFDAENNPELTFTSTGVSAKGDDYVVTGDLTLRGVTKSVDFDVEFNGFGTDPWGNQKAGLTAVTTIDRTDFGLTYNAKLEAGGVLVGEKVTITLELQAQLQADA